jgi:hypothetical protein
MHLKATSAAVNCMISILSTKGHINMNVPFVFSNPAFRVVCFSRSTPFFVKITQPRRVGSPPTWLTFLKTKIETFNAFSYRVDWDLTNVDWLRL